jgi:bis(5'-nucleosidyl)-tetraphosphatase
MSSGSERPEQKRPECYELLKKVDFPRKCVSTFGIIPLREVLSYHPIVFLVRARSGHWSFPKGHQEKNETDWATAQRELREETGLRVKAKLSIQPVVYHRIKWSLDRLLVKRIVLFAAEVEGKVKLQASEICDGSWVPLTNVRGYLPHHDATEFEKAEKVVLQMCRGRL